MRTMNRLTFEGRFCDIAQCTETPGGSFCEGGYCSQRKVWERLKQYEDTGYTPEEIAKLQGGLIMSNAELLKAREELKEHYDSISQLDGANSSLMAANEKLAADRKALINELCQYCGKYKQAHEGACDGCRWRDM
uniref:Uncharacterized protein n=1 Tax=Siphoviridae sp. ctjsp22 TaxID=2825636 RepID=A0A8S5V508_9CAUD|nr:MAG TPA: hypothetical protein [Siphoviridae sp. ctjsp22]DAO86184.1 MAG TPA: hypothetical protein [Caudoviricetes sp.]